LLDAQPAITRCEGARVCRVDVVTVKFDVVVEIAQ
jgi:hypothetical protein